MEIVRLDATDCALLSDRVLAHGNSHRRMVQALKDEGDPARVERVELLRRIERHFRIDLGSLCHRWQHRSESSHPLERMVLSYLVEHRVDEDGRDELWVLVDRVREVRDVIGEELPAFDGNS